MATLCARIRAHAPRNAGPSYPADSAAIMPAGAEVSTFLRCYHYREGDRSAPHYDKSFTEHFDHQLSAFSGYSVYVTVLARPRPFFSAVGLRLRACVHTGLVCSSPKHER